LEQDPDPDPLFHETDPRIRIYIKVKRIRNTAYSALLFDLITFIFRFKTYFTLESVFRAVSKTEQHDVISQNPSTAGSNRFLINVHARSSRICVIGNWLDNHLSKQQQLKSGRYLEQYLAIKDDPLPARYRFNMVNIIGHYIISWITKGGWLHNIDEIETLHSHSENIKQSIFS